MSKFIEFAPITRDDSWPVWLVRRRLYGKGREVSFIADADRHRIVISRRSPSIRRSIEAAVLLAQAAVAASLLS